MLPEIMKFTQGTFKSHLSLDLFEYLWLGIWDEIW